MRPPVGRLPATLVLSCCAGWHAHLGILLARLRSEEPEPFQPVYLRRLPVYQQQATRHLGAQPK